MTTFRFLHRWTTLPFLRDKEDVFLLPKHTEREEEEVKEVREEEIISNRAVKTLGGSRSFIIYMHFSTCARARGAGNGVFRKRKKEEKKKGDIGTKNFSSFSKPP